MKLGFKDAWAGWKRRATICPGCGSERVRYSRRQYEGLWSRLLRIRPVKCPDCGSYFPISARGSVSRSHADPVDLHLPFRPLELEGPGGSVAAGLSASGERLWWRQSRGVCPGCGSRSVREGRASSGESSLIQRLDLRESYRCLDCNAGFFRLSVMRLIAFGLLLFVVFGGLSYAVIRTFGAPRSSNSSPRIKQGQVPPPPPPVFR